jgi:hypothetical protein
MQVRDPDLASARDHIGQALRWGWKIEGRKRDFYDDDNAIIMGMTRAECRFLGKNGPSRETHQGEL